MVAFILRFSALDEGDGNPASAASYGRADKVSRVTHGFHNTSGFVAYRKNKCFH
jgi:hypothetical protein